VDESFDVIDETLMLDASRLIDLLFHFDGVRIDLGPQFSCYFDLLMSLGDVILDEKEHGLIRGEKNSVLMNVHVLR
jgi:hypothetical protein